MNRGPGTPTSSDAAEPTGSTFWRLLPALLILLGGLTATAIGYRLTEQLAERRLATAFHQVAEGHVNLLGRVLAEHESALQALQTFFASSKSVERHEFKTFTRPLLERCHFQALEWIPRVPAARVKALTDAVRADGFADFLITELDDSGSRVPAADRDVYYPVCFVEPLQSNEQTLGFDPSSNPIRRVAMLRARDTGTIATTPRIRLVQGSADKNAVLAFMPLYWGQPTNLEERRKQIVGFVVGVMRVDDLLATTVAGARTHTFMTTLSDMSAPEGERFLAARKQSREQPKTSRVAVEKTFDFGGRVWKIRCVPSSSFLEDRSSSLPNVVGLFSLAFTLLVVGYLLHATFRTRRIEAKIQIRTRQLEIARDAADHANRSKSEVLANMSHELRTPLTAILGFADVLLEHGEGYDPGDRFAAIETISRNGRHLLEIVNDILDLSKIEAGRLDVNRRRCSPLDILAHVHELMQFRAESKGLRFEVEFEGPLPETIETDEIRARQILMNLVGNAIKFTLNGEVKIVVRFMQRVVSRRLEFDIVDTGIGISAERATKLFSPFTQEDASTTRDFGGTGLGLSISRKLAEMLGGDVRLVSSCKGLGSRFQLALDAGRTGKMLESPSVEQASLTNRAKDAEADRLQCKILLAEDGLDNQRLISHVLKHAGASVTIVDNGQKAVELASTSEFDVILMDVQMPVMDGLQATRTLRETGYKGAIVAITANAMDGDREQCLQHGFDAYESKPINRASLFVTIQTLMAQPSSDRGPRATAAARS